MSTIQHEPARGSDEPVDGPVDVSVEGSAETEAMELPAGPVEVSVHHDVRWPALVALGCAVLTVVWFARALSSSDALDWAMTAVPVAVGLLMLALLRDARAPLLVADDDGVRVRRGGAWTGLRWADVESVEVRSRRGLTDGALVLHLAAPVAEVFDTDEAGETGETGEAGETVPAPVGDARREVSVPLGVGTRVAVEGLTGDLVEDLASLAAGRVPVRVLAAPLPAEAPAPAAESETDPETAPQTDPGTESASDDAARDAATALQAETGSEPGREPGAAEVVTERLQVVVLPHDSAVEAVLPEQVGPQTAADATDTTDITDITAATDVARPEPEPEVVEVVEAVAPAVPYVAGPVPDRATRAAARAEVVREGGRRMPGHAIPVQRVSDLEVVTARIEDVAVEAGPRPAADPVIGPVVAAARQRARLSVDTLSERTRIRPHVIECIEVDDFAPCGGDFYARGHLRTLARVFGLDAEDLVATYDERYAQPEIEAKQVFEAELASGVGGGLRTASSGPRWSMLAAAVVVLVGIWGTARVFSDNPEELVSPAPEVVDTAGLAGQEPAEPEVALGAVRVTADGASPQVVVRDAGGRILWAGQLADGRSQQVVGSAPFDVTASNGSAVRVDYLGKDQGTVGSSDAADNRRFG